MSADKNSEIPENYRRVADEVLAEDRGTTEERLLNLEMQLAFMNEGQSRLQDQLLQTISQLNDRIRILEKTLGLQ